MSKIVLQMKLAPWNEEKQEHHIEILPDPFLTADFTVIKCIRNIQSWDLLFLFSIKPSIKKGFNKNLGDEGFRTENRNAPSLT